MDIDNDETLEAILSKDLSKEVENSANFILREIRKNIWEIVYAPYKPAMYERLGKDPSSGVIEDINRRGGFIDSWISEKLDMNSLRSFSYSIYSEPYLMDNEFPHHSGFNGTDRTSVMSESIIRGINWDFSYKNKDKKGTEWWQKPRDFWSPTISVIKENFFGQSVSQEMRIKHGWDMIEGI